MALNTNKISIFVLKLDSIDSLRDKNQPPNINLSKTNAAFDAAFMFRFFSMFHRISIWNMKPFFTYAQKMYGKFSAFVVKLISINFVWNLYFHQPTILNNTQYSICTMSLEIGFSNDNAPTISTRILTSEG